MSHHQMSLNSDRNNSKLTTQPFVIQLARDEIYRSVSKKKKGDSSLRKVDYTNVEYVDPNYKKISKIDRQPKNY